MNNISLCIIKEFPSVKEGIFYLTKCSRQKLKKFNLSRKYLEKKCSKGMELNLPIDLVNQNMINPQYVGEEVPVSEDEKFLIISKPAQIHSHPLSYSESHNVLSFLRGSKWKDYLSINFENYDRGLIYRLDFETSGLILFAKTNEIYNSLRNTFSSSTKKKLYYALVEGNCSDHKDLVHFLSPSGKNGHKVLAHLTAERESKKACISIKQLRYDSAKQISLVQVDLKEGHRHQIRVQLAKIGNPIIGDPLYSLRKARRMYLHCHQYEIQIDKELYLYTDKKSDEFLKFFDFDGEL